MMQWRSISKDEMTNMWKELCGTMEEEVPEKYTKVEETMTGAYKGRGKPSEWRIVQRI